MVTAQNKNQMKLKAFVEGSIPDFNFLRSNITFVDFVNDPLSSDVHIIVNKKTTGSGGAHYYLSFNPVSFQNTDKLQLNCITSYQDTKDDIRLKFTESLKSGLLVFTNEKQMYYHVKVTENDNIENNSRTMNVNTIDKWDNWVFNIGMAGGFNAEEQKQQYSYNSTIEANRINEILRVRNDYKYERDDKFITKQTDTTTRVIHVFNQEQEFRSRIAYSLSSQLSVGINIRGFQTTYKNTKFNILVNPAIEYNFYPWKQLDRHIFTVAYFVGPSYYKYYEPTIYDKNSEILWSQNLKFDLQKIEKWGDIKVSLEASHYLPDFKYYSLQTSSELSVRIAKGLFLEIGFEAEKSNNQLYLPASELSDEDLLLNVRKLPTSYEISGTFGIRFQFGSIFNNVVNQRL